MNRLPAIRIYLIIQGCYWLFFNMMAMISAIYRVQSAGLDPLQLVLVGTVLEVSVFLFEIPTGIVADIVSRRFSVVIGYALIGLGFMVEGLFASFIPILLAQFIWGVGATFTSGALGAWLADEIGEQRLTQVYLRGSQFGRLGALAGILISTSLGTVALNLPIFWGGAGIALLAVFLALFMPETGFKPVPMPERNTFQRMAFTFQSGYQTIKGRPMLVTIMAIALIYGLSSEGLDRLWEAHLLANFTFPALINAEPVLWFGAINVAKMVLVISATEFVKRRSRIDEQEQTIRALLVTNGVMVGALLLFGLTTNIGIAVSAILAVFVVRGVGAPLFEAWLNRGLPSHSRATILSMRGQLDAIGQISGGPVIGFVGLRLGLRAAMAGVAFMLSPALWLFGRALGLQTRQQKELLPDEPAG